MIDISALNQFISIATSATVAGDDRITLTKNAQTNTATLGSVTTNVFSRLMERTFRTANTKENYRDIRQQLVNVLTSLFDIDNPSQLPLSVRKAFVSGEIVCGKPLTKRRLDAVLAATQQALGFDRGVAGLKELQKVAAMRATIEKVVASAYKKPADAEIVNAEPKKEAKKLGEGEGRGDWDINGKWVSEEVDEDELYWTDDQDDGIIEALTAEDIPEDAGFTIDELKRFYTENYKQDLGYFKTQAAAKSKRDEIHLITGAYESDAKRAESADALIKYSAYEGKIKTITMFLTLDDDNVLAHVMKAALNDNERILRSERSTPDEKKRALEFFAKLKAPKFAVVFDPASRTNKVHVVQQELVNLIKSFDDELVKITYKEKMKGIKDGIDKYIDDKINALPKEAEEEKKNLNDIREKMHGIAKRLCPFGSAMKDLMRAIGTHVQYLEEVATKMPHYASGEATITDTFDDLLGNRDDNIQDEV